MLNYVLKNVFIVCCILDYMIITCYIILDILLDINIILLHYSKSVFIYYIIYYIIYQSYQIISYHIISYHIISYHIISYHISDMYVYIYMYIINNIYYEERVYIYIYMYY